MFDPRNFIVHGSFFQNRNDILLVISNQDTKKYVNAVIHANINLPNEAGIFIQEMNNIIPPGKIKAFAFLTTEKEFDSFKSSYYFHQKMDEYCRLNGIFCIFFDSDFFNLHKSLRATNLDVVDDEEVLVICRKSNPQTPCSDEIDGIFVTKEVQGFRFKKYAHRMPIGFTSEWKKEFLEDSKPSRVVILQYFDDSIDVIEKMKFLFQKENAQIYSFGNTFDETVRKMNGFVLQKMNNASTPNDILPMSLNNFIVKYGDDIITAVPLDRVLPIEDILILDVDPRKSITVSTNQYNITVIQTFQMTSFKCKKVKIIFKVDCNSFYDLKLDAIGDEDVPMKNIPDTAKHRLVFDKKFFTIYEIEEGDQKVVKNLEGNSKTPLCIAFQSELKPLFGTTAAKILEKHGEFGVYDLIELCSIDNYEDVDPSWKYHAYKDDETGTMMVKLQTMEGERHANIAPFISLIFRLAYKIIRRQTQINAKEFEIIFNGFIPNETLKKNFITAGEFAKIKLIFL